MAGSDAILVVNAGSSSIKFGLFDVSPTEPVRLCRGQLDEQADKPRLVFTDPADKCLFETDRSTPDPTNDRLFADVMTWIRHYLGERRLRAVGHRVVHGGPDHSGPVEISQSVLASLEALTPLAPLHQPHCLAPIRTIGSIRPDLMQIACFDTAFHHSLTPPVSRFAIPRRFERAGIRRYGFHGLSFEYIANRLVEISPALASKRTVVAHLGSGASLCALRNGRSVDTTMGLTPLDGLVMGTRCGTVDPGVLLFLQQHDKVSVDDLQRLLYQESGLLGVSGISADMRTLLTSSEAAAKEAVDLFTFRVAQQVAVMTNTLGGLECLVFTGGIGEHATEIRSQVCERLGWLGVRLDPSANAETRQRMTAESSSVEILLIPTDEEMTIARHCMARAGDPERGTDLCRS